MTNTITIRELHRNLPKITREVAKGKHFTVLRHGKPAFNVSPAVNTGGTRRLQTLEDFLKISFRSGDKYLSQKVDEIVYGK